MTVCPLLLARMMLRNMSKVFNISVDADKLTCYLSLVRRCDWCICFAETTEHAFRFFVSRRHAERGAAHTPLDRHKTTPFLEPHGASFVDALWILWSVFFCSSVPDYIHLLRRVVWRLDAAPLRFVPS